MSNHGGLPDYIADHFAYLVRCSKPGGPPRGLEHRPAGRRRPRVRRIVRVVRELAARAPDQVPHRDADELRPLVRRPPTGTVRWHAPGSELPSRQDAGPVPRPLPGAVPRGDPGPLARLREA